MKNIYIIVTVLLVLLSNVINAQNRSEVSEEEPNATKEDKNKAASMSEARPFEVKKPNIESADTLPENEGATKPNIRMPVLRSPEKDALTMQVLEKLDGIGPSLIKDLTAMGLNRKKVQLVQGQNMALVKNVIKQINDGALYKDGYKAIRLLNSDHLKVLKELLFRDQYKKVKDLKKDLLKKSKNVLKEYLDAKIEKEKDKKKDKKKEDKDEEDEKVKKKGKKKDKKEDKDEKDEKVKKKDKKKNKDK